MQMTQVVVSDITTLQSRSKYTGIIGATWGFAAVVGPLLGGVLTSKASWRWCFWINLPTASLALVLLFFFLNLNPHTPPKIAYLISTFDFLGLFLLVAGLVVLLVGFTSGETSWSSAQTIACLVVGVCTLLAAVGVELKTKRSPIIPPRLFRIRTSAALLIGVFFQAFGFIPLSYYEPVRFPSPSLVPTHRLTFSPCTALLPSTRLVAAHVGRTHDALFGRHRAFRSRVRLHRGQGASSIRSSASQTCVTAERPSTRSSSVRRSSSSCRTSSRHSASRSSAPSTRPRVGSSPSVYPRRFHATSLPRAATDSISTPSQLQSQANALPPRRRPRHWPSLPTPDAPHPSLHARQRHGHLDRHPRPHALSRRNSRNLSVGRYLCQSAEETVGRYSGV